MEITRRQIIDLLKDGRDYELASIFEVRNYPPGFTFGPHAHNNLEINFVIKGNCAMQFTDQKVNFRKGDCMIIYPGVEHYFTVRERPTSLFQLEFKMGIFPELTPGPEMEKSLVFLYNILTNSQQYLKIINNQQINQLIEFTVKELNSRRKHYETMIRLLYSQLFILISRHIEETLKITNGHDNPLTREAIDFMNNHFTENISISSVAEKCNVSERYIRQIFKEATTLSPLEYLNQLKINKAKELLFDRNLSIKDITYLVGFSNPQYFTRRFKAVCGLTPTGFRKKNAVKYKDL